MPNFYARLAHRGALRVRGADTRKFLQGQTTCDLEQLSAISSLPGAYCTPQGRMVCDFRVVELAEDDVLMLMEADLCETVLASLSKYIVFSKAEMELASTDWIQLAAWGPDVANELGLTDGTLNQTWHQPPLHWIQVDADGQRFEACVPEANSSELDAITGALQRQSEEAYRLVEITAGIGHVTGATTEMFLPQMLNYQRTGRVSFNKGCYTGQEVVARMHYRGKTKRPMLLANVGSEESVNPGAPLFTPGKEQNVGNVVNSAPADGEVLMLVNTIRDAPEQDIRLGSRDGPALVFQALPYALEDGAGA